MLINTINGEMDDSLLIKRVDSFDEEVGKLTATEYCLKDCPGEAHKTGVAVGVGCFCPLHVHRSAHIDVKEGLEVSSVLNALVGA